MSAALAVYWNSASYGFVYDDLEGILNNPLITGFSRLSQAMQFFGEPWRPVTQFSYALTFYFAGAGPRAFHITNILIHAINSLLVYAIARQAAKRWMPAEKAKVFALAAGLIHAVHPVYSEAVSYIWGRSSSLCASFYFGSLLSTMIGYEKHGRKKSLWYGCAALSAILAWKTKEEAITLPLLIAGFFALAGSWRASAGMILVPAAVAAMRWSDIVRLYTKVKENQALVAAGSAPALDPFPYALTHIKASALYYLRMFLFPVNQNADPYITPVTRLADPLFLVSALVLVSLAVWGIVSARKCPAVSFALMSLVVSPLMAYMVMPLADVVAEHRVYVAGLGFDLLAAWFLSNLPRYHHAALAAAALGLGLLAFQRNEVWASNLTLWKDAERKSPELARPHLNLGLAYQNAGQAEAALAEYRHALAVNPNLVAGYVNLGGIHFSRNDLDSAERALQKAAELSPSLAGPYVDLAVIALRRNRAADALELLEKAAALEDSYFIHLNKGDALAQLGRYEEAVREYNRTIEMRPGLPGLKQKIEERLRWLRSIGAIR